MNLHRSTRAAAVTLLAGLSLVLSACFVTPGKFTSELILMDQDRFSFSYDGEIFFLGLSNLAALGAATDEFEAEDCYNEETYETRECTKEELTQQREAWDANAEMRAAEAAQQAQQMSAIMGGIDPTDPEASQELVQLLLRQKGWQSVEDKGDGVFEVSYYVEGELSHDFMFPVIEGFPMTNPFVQIILRDENIVRINAPGFAASNEGNPMGGMMAGMGGMAGLAGMAAMESGGSGGDNAGATPDIPVIEGTFRIVTNGRIRANNTDEGPNPTPTGELLEWEISPRTSQSPTALIQLNR